jgi:PAS domain S-box-containing protein
MPKLLRILRYQPEGSERVIFKETFLIYCGTIMVFCFFFFAFVNYFLEQYMGALVMLAGAFLKIFVLILFVKKVFLFKTAVNIGLSCSAATLFTDIHFAGGIYSPGLSWVILFPFISFLLLGRGISTQIWIAVSVGVVLFFCASNPSRSIVIDGITVPKYDYVISSVGMIVMVCLLTYIFEKKKQQEIKDSEMQFRTMFEQASSGITIFSPKTGQITDLNPRYEQIIGRSKKEIQKMGWVKFTHPEDLPQELKLMDQLNKGEISGYKLEKRYIRPDKSIVWVDLTISAFKIRGGLDKLYMCIIEDISERKLLEEEQGKAKELLEYNARMLAIQNDQLNDFCDIVSHNLRAPLASISMITDYIGKSKEEEERLLLLNQLKPVVSNLNEIFNELVEALQVEHDHEIQSDEIRLEEVMGRIFERFEAEIQLTGAEIQVDIAATPTIRFPRLYLDSVLSNLISNALKYRSVRRNPSLSVSTLRVENSIVLKVEDNGLGIDLVKHRHNVFKIRKVFHDHPDAKGFGLFITKKQIEALGGNIEVESTPDEGTVFTVTFVNQHNG